VAQLVYDLTVRFCDRYIDKRSRTHDQMVQAARSGVQNIAEGSQASGTSKRTELKLTNVARASLEELRLDYEDFLRQRGLAQWDPNQPALRRFKARRCATLEEVRTWVDDERMRFEQAQTNRDKHRPTRTNTDRCERSQRLALSVTAGVRPCQSMIVRFVRSARSQRGAVAAEFVLLFLDRQLAAQAAALRKKADSRNGFTVCATNEDNK